MLKLRVVRKKSSSILLIIKRVSGISLYMFIDIRDNRYDWTKLDK